MENKKILRILIAFAFLTFVISLLDAQVPQSLNYQAMLRNESGQILQNQNSTVKLSVHSSTLVGAIVYEETHETTTDNYGLVNLQIGQGNPVSGVFQNIQWGTDNYFLQVQVDIGYGFVDLGTTQFVTVPYALVADTALHSPGLQVVNHTATLTGDGTNNNPLSLASQGAITGQSLKWIGNTWLPADDNDTQQLNLDGTSLTISNGNTVVLPSSTGWNLIGNSGTIPDNNFIGTTDEQPIDFKTNNLLKARITTKGQIEMFNTGNSVFIGKGAGKNDDLSSRQNVFIGDSAGFANTSGNNNVSIGYAALRNNTSLKYNIAIGSYALFKQSYDETNSSLNDQQNIAIGYKALFNNQPTSWANGDNNIAIGRTALFFNTTGNNNVVIGNLAHQSNTHGSNNTIIGHAALNSGTETASFNTAVGAHSANTSFVLSDFNTSIGFQTGVDADNRTNTIVIGGSGNLPLGGSNRVRIGNSSMSSIGGQVGWTTLSDERVKENVRYDVKGLSFIMNLKPATYNYSIAKSNRLQNKVDTLDWDGKYDIQQMKFSGFLAQEVEKAAQEAGCDFSGIDKPENESGLWGLRYAEFVVPLVKGMQEQQLMIDALKMENDSQKTINEDLQKQISLLQIQLDKLQVTNKK